MVLKRELLASKGVPMHGQEVLDKCNQRGVMLGVHASQLVPPHDIRIREFGYFMCVLVRGHMCVLKRKAFQQEQGAAVHGQGA